MSEDSATESGATPAQGASVGPASLPSEAKLAALAHMAKADDVSDYVAERRDQDAEERGEARNDPDRRAARSERYRRAIEQVRQADEQKPDSSAAADQSAAEDTAGHDADPQERDQRVRTEAEFGLRSREYFQKNPGLKAELETTFGLYPPSDHVADIIMRSEVGPAIAHELSKIPDAILDLNEMNPAEAARILGIVEGRLRMQDHYSESERAAPQARRTTKAPAPLSVVRGGASPTPNLHELAKKDDVTEYVRVRRAQDRAARG